MMVGKRVRLWALFIHVLTSVGWMGAIAAFLLFSIKGQTAREANAILMCAESMRLIGWMLVVPLCIAATITGLVQSVISTWGLLQHYWVLLKLVLMVGATGLLFLHMQAVDQLAAASRSSAIAASGVFSSLSFDALAALILIGLLTALSIFKPVGRVFKRD